MGFFNSLSVPELREWNYPFHIRTPKWHSCSPLTSFLTDTLLFSRLVASWSCCWDLNDATQVESRKSIKINLPGLRYFGRLPPPLFTDADQYCPKKYVEGSFPFLKDPKCLIAKFGHSTISLNAHCLLLLTWHGVLTAQQNKGVGGRRTSWPSLTLSR